MLCYRSDRTVADIVRDSIQWLVENRRACLYASIPVLMACVLGVQIIGHSYDPVKSSSIDNIFDSIFDTGKWGTMIVVGNRLDKAVFIMSTVAAFALTPFLHCYFARRVAVRGINGSEALGIMTGCFWRALLAGLLWGVTVTGMLRLGFFTGILVYVAGMIITPMVVMDGRPGGLRKPRIWLLVGSLAGIYVIAAVIRAIPVLCVGLIDLIIMLSDDSLGYDMSENMVQILMSALQSVAFCLSVAVMLVSSVLLHGTMYNPSKKQ